LRVGIAFNLLPTGPSRPPTDGPDDQFEEFDKPETVDAIAKVLCSRGHEVLLLGDGPGLIRQVLDDPPDLVWNMAEGHGVGRSREARVPAVLEMLGIPYTGSDPLTLAATLDKDVAKRIVASDGTVWVPRGVAFRPGVGRGEFWDRIDLDWTQPDTNSKFLVKPSFEGSSKGIRARCLCKTWEEAWKTYRDLASDYWQTILVEEFIEGDEITVSLVGAGEILGVMRVIPKRPSDEFIYSLEVKRDWRRLVDYEAPARLGPNVEERLLKAARESYRLLGCRDVARIDFRIRQGRPYFIEANPLPGLAPGTSDLVILAEGYGLSHADLIGRIFEAALARLGMPER
jgi:D-alanine-D-alanine ligase